MAQSERPFCQKNPVKGFATHVFEEDDTFATVDSSAVRQVFVRGVRFAEYHIKGNKSSASAYQVIDQTSMYGPWSIVRIDIQPQLLGGCSVNTDHDNVRWSPSGPPNREKSAQAKVFLGGQAEWSGDKKMPDRPSARPNMATC
jgi:hypothetical protein